MLGGWTPPAASSLPVLLWSWQVLVASGAAGALLQGRLCLPPQLVGLAPEAAPRCALLLGELGEGLGTPYAGEVRVRQPVGHRLRDGQAGLGRLLPQQAAPGPQVGVQPGQRLTPPAESAH